MWDLPRPGLEPASPALAGRFSTTAPPGKPEGGSLHGLSFHLERTIQISVIVSPPTTSEAGFLQEGKETEEVRVDVERANL